MPYYWVLQESSVIIPERDEVCNVLKKINEKYHLVKKGNSSDGEKWFTSMPINYDQIVTSVREVMQLLSFDCEDYYNYSDSDDEEEDENEDYDLNDEHNHIQLTRYNGIRGQEMLFLAVIAPYIKSGSYMQFKGEDNLIFEYTFENKKMYEQIYDPYDSDDETMQRGKKQLYQEYFYSNYKNYKIDIYSNKEPFDQYKEQLEEYVNAIKE